MSIMFSIPAITSLLLLILGTHQSFCHGAEVSGTVTDYTTGKPIDGVRVSLFEGKKRNGPMATANGNYSFDSVGLGSFRVSFDAVGYTPRPDDYPIEIKMANDKKQVDTELMKEGGMAAYYTAAGQRFVELVMKDGGKRVDYERRWAQLRRIGPAPTNKVTIVEAIDKKDPVAKESLPLAQYLNVDRKQIKELEAAFEKAISAGGEMMPRRGVAESREELVADIVVFRLRQSDANMKVKTAFVDRFVNSEWKGTRTAEIVKTSYGPSLLMRPDPK